MFIKITFILSMMTFMLIPVANAQNIEDLLRDASECNSVNDCPSGAYVVDNTEDLKKIGDIIFDKMGGITIFNHDDVHDANYPEFSDNRYAILLKPSNDDYRYYFYVGYYTQLLGLGAEVGDVKIGNMGVTNQCWPTLYASVSACQTTGALNNFWRGVENLTITQSMLGPGDPNNPIRGEGDEAQTIWAASQAAPLRRVHVQGSMILCDWRRTEEFQGFPCGLASGGYMADVKVDVTVTSGSQQQYFIRNTNLDYFNDGVWNMAFVGVEKVLGGPIDIMPPAVVDPIQGGWQVSDEVPPQLGVSDYPFTIVPKTPKIAEKPFLIYKEGVYHVRVPQEKEDTVGVSWDKGNEDWEDFDVNNDFIVLTEENYMVLLASDSYFRQVGNVYEVQNGKHLLFFPGVYNLIGKTIVVKEDNTVVLGIGMASLICGEQPCIDVQARGARVSGLMLDAGASVESMSEEEVDRYVANNTTSLLKVSQTLGDETIYLHDIFCRIGGAAKVGVDRCVQIDADNVVGDHFWLWRADHGVEGAGRPDDNIGWYANPSNKGLVVNGENVTVYGLFNEHHRGYQTQWLGEKGNLYFYQSELAYDPPSEQVWAQACTEGNNQPGKGCPSYKVADDVENHFAAALGIYSYFPHEGIIAANAIQAPSDQDKVTFAHVMTAYLNGNEDIKDQVSGIKAVINRDGCPAVGSYEDVDLEVAPDQSTKRHLRSALGQYPLQLCTDPSICPEEGSNSEPMSLYACSADNGVLEPCCMLRYPIDVEKVLITVEVGVNSDVTLIDGEGERRLDGGRRYENIEVALGMFTVKDNIGDQVCEGEISGVAGEEGTISNETAPCEAEGNVLKIPKDLNQDVDGEEKIKIIVKVGANSDVTLIDDDRNVQSLSGGREYKNIEVAIGTLTVKNDAEEVACKGAVDEEGTITLPNEKEPCEADRNTLTVLPDLNQDVDDEEKVNITIVVGDNSNVTLRDSRDDDTGTYSFSTGGMYMGIEVAVGKLFVTNTDTGELECEGGVDENSKLYSFPSSPSPSSPCSANEDVLTVDLNPDVGEEKVVIRVEVGTNSSIILADEKGNEHTLNTGEHGVEVTTGSLTVTNKATGGKVCIGAVDKDSVLTLFAPPCRSDGNKVIVPPDLNEDVDDEEKVAIRVEVGENSSIILADEQGDEHTFNTGERGVEVAIGSLTVTNKATGGKVCIGAVNEDSVLTLFAPPCASVGDKLIVPPDLNEDVDDEKAEITVNVGGDSSITLTDDARVPHSLDTGEHAVEVAIGNLTVTNNMTGEPVCVGTVDVHSILSQVTSPCNATGSVLIIPGGLNSDVGGEKAEIIVNVGANSSVTLTDSAGVTRSLDTGEHTGVEVAIGGLALINNVTREAVCAGIVDENSILSLFNAPCNATGNVLIIPGGLNPDVGGEKAEIVVNVGANSSITLTDSVGMTQSLDTGEHTGIEVAIGGLALINNVTREAVCAGVVDENSILSLFSAPCNATGNVLVIPAGLNSPDGGDTVMVIIDLGANSGITFKYPGGSRQLQSEAGRGLYEEISVTAGPFEILDYSGAQILCDGRIENNGTVIFERARSQCTDMRPEGNRLILPGDLGSGGPGGPGGGEVALTLDFC
ncbi:MAG: hypothetical protein V3V61_05170 [Gammaproteobacteria bacterium]